jgi:signal transduction histidine kinase
MTNKPVAWLRSKTRARLPGRTLRLRLTLVYSGLFLLCGAVLLTVTYVLFERATDVSNGKGPPIQFPVRQLHNPALIRQAGLSRAADLHQLLVDSGVALAVLAVVALLLGWFVAGRVLRPLRTITATARRISASNLGERLNLGGPNDELKELGDTFDELLGRLQRSWESQRQFISNVSHELRSPLTRLRLQAEIAATDSEATVGSLQAGYTAVIAAAQQQEELIAALLSLARGQRGLGRKETFDLAPIAYGALQAQRQQAEGRGLHVSTAFKPATVGGDHRLIAQLICNLVDNAIAHNTVGGEVHLATATEAGHALIVVSNDGVVIPTTELRRLFRPFERLEPGRRHHKTGHGLGLSIVDAIATAHGAVITARSRPEGGLAVEVAFPGAPVQSLG